ncbi:MAG: protein kinase [Isosphaeraceae bacterium]
MDHPSEAALRALFQEKLSEEEAGRVAVHLESCAECLARAERLTAVPPDLWAFLASTVGPTSEPHIRVPEVPGYEGLCELGRGGCGVVYRATETATNREVALKVLRGGALASPAERAWFLAEARAAAALRHPNVVTVFAVGEAAGLPYYAMEFLPAGPLSARLDGSPFPLARAVALAEAVAGALHHAHENGVVHRDVKPGNILIDATEGGGRNLIPKVSDFGTAKRPEPSTAPTPSHAILGTVEYMAPEQAFGRSRDAGPAADVYSLGAVLYELLTGRRPFRGATPYETLLLVRNEEPVHPRRLRPVIPRDLETVCLKCLEKDPGRRYATAADLAADLRAHREGRPVAARPVGPGGRLARWARRSPGVAGLSAGSLLLLLTALTLVTFFWQRSEDQKSTTLDFAALAAEATSKLFLHPDLVSEADRAAIARQAEILERISDMARSPEEERRFAYASLQLANGLYELGETDRSARATGEAMRRLRRLAESPGNHQRTARYHYAQGCIQLAALAERQGRADEELRRYEEAVAVAEGLARDYPGVDAYLGELAIFQERLAVAYADRGRDDPAETLLKWSLAGNRKMVHRYPHDPGRYGYYHDVNIRYGALLIRRRRDAERYLALARERMDLCEAARRQKEWHLIAPKLLHLQPIAVLDRLGEKSEASRLLAQGLTIWRELAARTPLPPRDREEYARWLDADGHRRWPSDPDAAGRSFREAVGVLTTMTAGPDGTASDRALAEVLLLRPDPGGRDVEKALVHLRRTPADPASLQHLFGIARFESGDFPTARDELQRFVDSAGPSRAILARTYLAMTYARLGDRERAVRELETARRAVDADLTVEWPVLNTLERAGREVMP